MRPVHEILAFAAAFYGVKKSVLLGGSRIEPMARIRFSIIGACRDEGHHEITIDRALHRKHGAASRGLKHLTPQHMAGMWANHLRFLTELKAQSDRLSVKRQLTQIDRQIHDLNLARQRLVSAENALRKIKTSVN